MYQGIKQKIIQLKEIDTKYYIFGSTKHHYEIKEVLSIVQVSELEKKYQIVLPSEYVNFITTISNGGVGPSYGMYSIQESFNDSSVNELSFEELIKEEFKWDINHEYIEDEEASDQEYEMEVSGSIIIAHHGCGIYSRLVVSGQDFGSVWTDERASDGGLYRSYSNFNAWYVTWLNESIEAIHTMKEIEQEMNQCAKSYIVEDITGIGRARSLLIKDVENEMKYKVYHYEENEFLEEGETSNLIERGDIVKFICSLKDVKEYKRNITQQQMNFTEVMSYDISVMQSDASINIKGKIISKYYSSITSKRYYHISECSIGCDLWICSYKDLNYELNNYIEVSACLEVLLVE